MKEKIENFIDFNRDFNKSLLKFIETLDSTSEKVAYEKYIMEYSTRDYIINKLEKLVKE